MWRPAEYKDLKNCLSLNPAAMGYEMVGHEGALAAWQTLLRSRSFNSAVIEPEHPNRRSPNSGFWRQRVRFGSIRRAGGLGTKARYERENNRQYRLEPVRCVDRGRTQIREHVRWIACRFSLCGLETRHPHTRTGDRG